MCTLKIIIAVMMESEPKCILQKIKIDFIMLPSFNSLKIFLLGTPISSIKVD